eukprot:m.253355 g.253355  ORF g.253355 m.253355 type:complete len:2762 (+) comp15929_c1_seq8:148-8433(+)
MAEPDSSHVAIDLRTESYKTAVSPTLRHTESYDDALLAGGDPNEGRKFLHVVSQWAKSKLGRIESMLAALAFFYSEFISDLVVIHSLFTFETDTVTESNPVVTSAWFAVGIVILTPTFVSIVDVCYKPLSTDTTSIAAFVAILKGLVVNWTNTRPLLVAWSAIFKGTNLVESWQAIVGIRFLHLLLRTLPMLFLESAMLAAQLLRPTTAATALALSTANASYLLTVHALGLYGHSVRRLSAIPIFLYFLSDVSSRFLAVYIVVAAKGMTFVAVGSWLLVWLFLDGAIRFAWKLAKDKQFVDRDRSSLYVMDPSIVSTLASVFSALPLSRNPTERIWLWWTSTLVLVVSVAWAIGSTDGISIGRTSVQLFTACIILKTLIFLLFRMFNKHKIDKNYDGREPFGSATFTFSNTGETAEAARRSYQWASWYEQETSAALSKDQWEVTRVAIDWSRFQDYGPVKYRYEGLQMWLLDNEIEDKFDRHLVGGGKETFSWINGQRTTESRAKSRIERRAGQRMSVDKLNVCCSLKEVLNEEKLGRLLNNLTGLRTLDLSSNGLGKLSSDFCLLLGGLISLESVNLSSNLLDHDFVLALSNAFRDKSLKEINLGHNNLGNAATRIFKELDKKKSLLSIDLSGNNLDPDSGEEIASFLNEFTSLRTLKLAKNRLGPTGGAAIARELTSNETITDIDLSSNELHKDEERADALDALAVVLTENKRLKSIDLSNNNLRCKGGSILAKGLKNNETLTALRLNQNNIKCEGAKEIASALNDSVLKTISMEGNTLGLLGGRVLADSLKYNDFLEEIELANNNLSLAFAESLAASLQRNSTLKILTLQNNDLGPQGVTLLANALSENSSVINVNLLNNKMGPEGGTALAAMLEVNTTLLDLELGRNSIGPKGAKDLTEALKKNTTLTEIGIEDNDIGFEGEKNVRDAVTGAFAARTCFDAPEVWQKSKWMRTIAILFSVGFFYYDFATDVEVIVGLFAASNRGTDSHVTTYAAWLSVMILVLTPLVMFGMDCAEERSSKNVTNGPNDEKDNDSGTDKENSNVNEADSSPTRRPQWQRVLLSFVINFTNTRPLYVTASSFFDGMYVEADEAVTDIKFLEVLLESLPQMFLQSAVLAASLVDAQTVMRSLALSVLNAAWSCTSRALQMYGSSVLDFAKTFKASFVMFLYLLCDVMSRASATFILVAVHGMSVDPVVWWLLGWFGLDMLVRKVTAFLDGHRAESWVVDNSTLSALAGILSSLPMTRNPTERRWLFIMSIAFPVGAVSSSIPRDEITNNSREGQAAAVFVAAIILKSCIYLVGEMFILPHFDRGYDGADPHGRAAFALSKFTDSSRGKYQWIAWYEQETRTRTTTENRDERFQVRAFEGCVKTLKRYFGWNDGRTQLRPKPDPFQLRWNHCKGFGETRNRYEGLVAWVEKHREKDVFDRHLIKSGFESCWTCRWIFGNETERAALRIEKRRNRRMVVQELNACGALVGFPNPESSRRISDALPDLPGLKILSLSRNDIGPVEGAILAASLNKIVSLASFDLSSNALDHVGGATLAAALKTNKTLVSLDLGSNNIGDGGAEAIGESLKANTTLQELNLASNKVGSVGAEALGLGLMMNSSVTKLILSSNNIGDRGVQAFAAAIGHGLDTTSRIKELDLSSNEIGDKGATDLANGLKTNTTLTAISVSDNKIEIGGWVAMGEALKVNKSLTTIDLSRNKLGSEGATALSNGLFMNRSLKTIYLQKCKLGPTGGTEIANVLRHSTVIEFIDLHDNRLGPEGGTALAEALKWNKTLKTVILYTNELFEEGGVALNDALGVNTTISFIDLRDNDLGYTQRSNLALKRTDKRTVNLSNDDPTQSARQSKKSRSGFLLLTSFCFFYFEIITSILVIADLFLSESDDNAAKIFAGVLLAVLFLYPTVMTVLNAKETPFPLLFTFVNFTYTLPLLIAAVAMVDGSSVKREMGRMNLFSVFLEALPALFVQSVVLATDVLTDKRILIVSLAASVATISSTCTAGTLAMYGESPLDIKNLATTCATFLYFLCDVLTRLTAIYVLVTVHGERFGAFGTFVVSVCADVLFRFAPLSLYSLSQYGEFDVQWALNMESAWRWWWIPDYSITSSVAGIFAAMPLSRNPAERRFLCLISTITLSAAVGHAVYNTEIWNNESVKPVALLFTSCMAFKVIDFLLGELLVFPHFDSQYNGLGSYGLSRVTGYNISDPKPRETDWVNLFEEMTKNSVRTGQTKPIAITDTGRFSGLVKWLEKMEMLDESDRQTISNGGQKSLWCGPKDEMADSAKRKIAMRKKQRSKISSFTAVGVLQSASINDIATILMGLINLRSLNLSSNDLGADFGTLLLRVFQETDENENTITTLNVSNNNLGPSFGKYLSGILKSKALTKLDLKNVQLESDGAEGFAEALKENTTLKKVSLARNQLEEVGGIAVANALKENKTLSHIDLSRNNIQGTGGKELISALEVNEGLESIDLSQNYLRLDGVRSALEKNKTLSVLNLAWNNLGPDGGFAFAEGLRAAGAAGNTALKSVNLDGNFLGPESGIKLADALFDSTLTTISLQNNEFGPAGGTALASAIANSMTLTAVYLGGNSFGPEPGMILAEAIKATKLVTLDLHDNNLGPLAGRQFAVSLRENMTVTTIDLQSNNLDHMTGVLLAETLETNTTLKNVNLCDNDIGSEGGLALASALEQNMVVTVNLKKNDLGPEFEAVLRRSSHDTQRRVEFDVGFRGRGQTNLIPESHPDDARHEWASFEGEESLAPEGV